MEGNGIVQPDLETSGGEVSGEGSGEGSGTDDKTEGSGEKVLTMTPTTEKETEGSGGSGYGETETTRPRPPVVRTSPTTAPTIPACHPNDHNCQSTESSNGEGSNAIIDGDKDNLNFNWPSVTQQQKRQLSKKESSASTLSLNLLAVAFSALLACLLL